MGDLEITLPGYRPPSTAITEVYFREEGAQEWTLLGTLGEDGLILPSKRRWRVGVECGQRWWRLRSWRRCRLFRRLPSGAGFAVGPIMVIRDVR